MLFPFGVSKLPDSISGHGNANFEHASDVQEGMAVTNYGLLASKG
jgi:hypothetical protein